MTAPAIVSRAITPISRDVIKLIAENIGKEVATHIESMYPRAVEATSPNMLRSVRGCVINEIMDSLELTDEAAILERLERTARERRAYRAAYRKNRDKPVTEDVAHDTPVRVAADSRSVSAPEWAMRQGMSIAIRHAVEFDARAALAADIAEALYLAAPASQGGKYP